MCDHILVLECMDACLNLVSILSKENDNERHSRPIVIPRVLSLGKNSVKTTTEARDPCNPSFPFHFPMQGESLRYQLGCFISRKRIFQRLKKRRIRSVGLLGQVFFFFQPKGSLGILITNRSDDVSTSTTTLLEGEERPDPS